MIERILIATIGATPQVVTETVWALANDPIRAPWHPTRIEIVTTARNLREISHALQRPDGPLATLFEGAAPQVMISVPVRPRAENGAKPLVIDWLGGEAPPPLIDEAQRLTALDDVTSAGDAEIIGDLIKDRVWAATRPGAGFTETEIHVSIAGGRKTMSAHALLSLALLGRVQDEASHVLVWPPAFESNPAFWHKGQAAPINTASELAAFKRDGTPLPAPTLDVAKAHIALVRTPTPFVTEIKNERAALAKLRLSEIIRQIDLANRFRRAPAVVLFRSSNTLMINDASLRLMAVDFAMIRFLATAMAEQWPGAGPGGHEGHCGWVSQKMLTTERDRNFNPIRDRLLPIVLDALRVEGIDTSWDELTPQMNNRTHAAVRNCISLIEAFRPAGSVRSGGGPAKLAAEKAIRSWFGSLNGPRSALEQGFGLPLANLLLPGARGPNGDKRFGLGCPANCLTMS